MEFEREEIIAYYKTLEKEVDNIRDPQERRAYISSKLNRFSLAEWCTIGEILRSAKLI